MAHGDYYNPANKSVTDGTVVYADDVNKINTAVDSAFEQVAYDLDVIEADLEAGGLSAKNWATEDQGTRPDPILDLYSAKAYALEAKGWASAAGTITEASTGTALAGSASAKTKAAEAAASALAASGSASSASGSASIATTKAGEALNSANAAALSETNAGNSAISAAASAVNLPNATTAGANKLLTTNSSGNGWEYPSITTAGKAILDDASAAAQRTTLGLGNVANVDTTNASNISSGILADARIPSTIARDSEVSALLAARPRKNLLINGGFDVWQRGLGPFLASAPFTADRWAVGEGLPLSLMEVSAVIPSASDRLEVPFLSRYILGLQARNALNISIYVTYKVEGLAKFSGQTLTLSLYSRVNSSTANLRFQPSYNFGTGGSPSATMQMTASPNVLITDSFVRHSFTFTVPDLSSKLFGTDANSDFLELTFFLIDSGTGRSYFFANVQLEFGDTATDFEYRHPAEELALCQRYYEKGTLCGPFAQYLDYYAVGPYVPFLVEKRKVPSITLGTLAVMGHDGTPGAVASTTAFTRGFNPVYDWIGGTVGRSFFGQATWTADAEL